MAPVYTWISIFFLPSLTYKHFGANSVIFWTSKCAFYFAISFDNISQRLPFGGAACPLLQPLHFVRQIQTHLMRGMFQCFIRLFSFTHFLIFHFPDFVLTSICLKSGGITCSHLWALICHALDLFLIYNSMCLPHLVILSDDCTSGLPHFTGLRQVWTLRLPPHNKYKYCENQSGKWKLDWN